MKKFRGILVGILTLILSLFCLAGCFEKGVYKVSEYKAGMLSIDVDETQTESYIELAGDNVAKMSIDIAGVVTLEGEGTWEKGEEDKTYVLNIEGAEYTVTIEDGEMTIDLLGTKIVLVKE